VLAIYSYIGLLCKFKVFVDGKAMCSILMENLAKLSSVFSSNSTKFSRCYSNNQRIIAICSMNSFLLNNVNKLFLNTYKHMIHEEILLLQ
jgi:hypothetical protein